MELTAPEIYDLAIHCHASLLRDAVLITRPNIENPNAPRPTPVMRCLSKYELGMFLLSSL